MKLGSKNWPYIVGLAGAAALAYLWLAPRLIKPGIGTNIYGNLFGGHPMHPMAHARAAMAPTMMMPHAPMHRNTNLVGESGGTIPLGGGIAGVTRGGGTSMFPVGVRGHPGGYGVSNAYMGEALGSSRLAVA